MNVDSACDQFHSEFEINVKFGIIGLDDHNRASKSQYTSKS